MFKFFSNSLLRCASVVSLSLIACSKAELPSFQEVPWLGYFAYGENEKMIIKVSADGDISAHPIGKKGKEVAYLVIPFKFSIRQTLPNGKMRALKIDPKSLTSKNEITGNLKETTITGEAGKGATFEINLLFKRDSLILGGSVTGTGSEKLPLSFHYQSKINHYHGALLKRLKGNQVEFDKIVGKDGFELFRADKKKEKRSLTDVFEKGDEAKLNGPGCLKIEIEAAIIDRKKRMLVFEAKGASLYTLIKPKYGPFHQGYFIEWSPDQEKDPKNEARLTFKIEAL